MLLKIKDLDTGQIYSSNMSDDNKHTILDINFCTSYTQVSVQDEIDGKFSCHDMILPPIGTTPDWVDQIATQNDPEGEWVNA